MPDLSVALSASHTRPLFPGIVGHTLSEVQDLGTEQRSVTCYRADRSWYRFAHLDNTIGVAVTLRNGTFIPSRNTCQSTPRAERLRYPLKPNFSTFLTSSTAPHLSVPAKFLYFIHWHRQAHGPHPPELLLYYQPQANMCFGKKQGAFGVSNIELQKSEEIDKMIRKDRKRMKKEIKILLLGRTTLPS